MKNTLKRFVADERAVGVVELVLILVVLIGLVVIFKNQLTSIINSIFERVVAESAAL